MKRRRIPAFGLALLIAASSLAAGEPNGFSVETRDRARGWFWYDDPAKPRERAEVRESESAPSGTEKPELVRQFEAIQQRYKEARMALFVDPSPQHAREMAEIQTEIVRRASAGADVWQRVIWANPQFDFTLDRPVSQVALAARDQAQRVTRAALLERVAASQVLYFFFRGDCPYCHAFAPILAGFARATGIRVFPVSLDGDGLPDFPQPVMDNGIAANLKVTTVPALFLADPASARIAPVGFGVMSEMDLAERIEAIAAPESPALQAATPSQPLQAMESHQ